MSHPTRRSVLRGSASVVAAGSLGRPFIANAAATTAEVWWTQGFVPEEDAAVKKTVADYEKASGNTIELSIMPFAPLRQKIISAVTSGVVPDMFSQSPNELIALLAWDDKLLDLTDIVDTQKEEFTETALLNAYCYNSVEKRRSFYGAPDITAASPNHVWRPLVEKAGFKVEDIPKTWDAYYDFFKDVQKKLRAQGVRNVYGLGFQVTTNGNDPNELFNYFLVAYGGQGIVTKDGKLHLDDPKVREAAVKALTYCSTAYKDGFVPPGAVNWNDADDNNAFHAKQILADFDGTISTEVAMIHDKQAYYHDAVTLGLPLGNDGKPVPAELGAGGCFMAKGCKNEKGGKEFIKYLSQPKVTNEYLKNGLGRWLPCYPSLVKTDPFWLDPKDPHRPPYTRQALLGPSIPYFYVFNPGIAVANAQQVWGQMQADVIRNGAKPQDAADKGFKQIETILENYKIVQS